MSLQFFNSKPLQASKLTAIIGTLLFAAGGIFGVIPDQGFTGLFLIIVLSIGLALVITAETLLAGYRSLTTDTPLTDQLTARPIYNTIRAIEVVGVIGSSGGVWFLATTLPDESPAGPGAIGLLFIVTGISLVLLGGSLIRTLPEYYYYHRNTQPESVCFR